MVTLADVAKKAEVSTATVSRVLNNRMPMPISQATIDRIRRAAAQMDYQPHAAARALATGKSRTIGLHYAGTTETMFLRILKAVETRARERGYHLVVSSDLESFSAASAIDGLIYVASLDTMPVQASPCRKPTVYVSPSREADSRSPANHVTWSESDAAYRAVEHLVSLGHRRIGALWGDYADDASVWPRVAGFRAAIARFGAEGIERFGERNSDPIQMGFEQMRRLLEQYGGEVPVTALFVRNDYLAVGALKALHQAGIKIPEQVSLIHYGDSVLSQAAHPELTSVSHPNAEACVLALEKVIDMSEKGGRDFDTISLPITLCERASCAPPPRPQGDGHAP
jgi:LacI family transcriptional regulator